MSAIFSFKMNDMIKQTMILWRVPLLFETGVTNYLKVAARRYLGENSISVES